MTRQMESMKTSIVQEVVQALRGQISEAEIDEEEPLDETDAEMVARRAQARGGARH